MEPESVCSAGGNVFGPSSLACPSMDEWTAAARIFDNHQEYNHRCRHWERCPADLQDPELTPRCVDPSQYMERTVVPTAAAAAAAEIPRAAGVENAGGVTVSPRSGR